MITLKIGILVEKNSKVLLIKERNDKDNKYYWNIIKGTFEPNKDRNILDCAIRECQEEAKVKIELKKILNIIYLKKLKKIILQINFLAIMKNKKVTLPKLYIQRARNEDIIDYKFFTKKELKNIKRKELMNKRTYLIIKDWLNNRKFDLTFLKILNN